MDNNKLIELIVINFIPVSIGIGILLISVVVAIAIFIKIVGNPIKVLFEIIKGVAPIMLNELKFAAGPIGLINFIIVLFTFILALSIIFKPNLINYFTTQNNNNLVIALIIFLLTIFLFYASARLILDYLRWKYLISKNKFFREFS
jgi:hypothetical protein